MFAALSWPTKRTECDTGQKRNSTNRISHHKTWRDQSYHKWSYKTGSITTQCCCLWILTLKINVYKKNNNLVLTRHEGYSGEYLPEVVTVQTNKCSEVCMKITKDYNSPVRLEQARLITNLFMAPKPNLFIFSVLACKNKNTWFMAVYEGLYSKLWNK